MCFDSFSITLEWGGNSAFLSGPLTAFCRKRSTDAYHFLVGVLGQASPSPTDSREREECPLGPFGISLEGRGNLIVNVIALPHSSSRVSGRGGDLAPFSASATPGKGRSQALISLIST